MSIWAHVDDGELTEWRFGKPAGAWRNVSNIEALSADELAPLGWREASLTEDEVGVGQIAGSPVMTVAGDGSILATIPAVSGPVPQMVTNAQMRCALRGLGLLASIKAAASADMAAHNAIDPTDDGEFWERWEYGNFIGRHDAFVLQMQAAFEKTDADMDAIFRLAETK